MTGIVSESCRENYCRDRSSCTLLGRFERKRINIAVDNESGVSHLLAAHTNRSYPFVFMCLHEGTHELPIRSLLVAVDIWKELRSVQNELGQK